MSTYILTIKEYNSDGQEGQTTVKFKAESLDALAVLYTKYENGLEDSNIVQKFRGPKTFHEAGGFCSETLSFICKESRQDILPWLKALLDTWEV